jgi:hypothetical protein
VCGFSALRAKKPHTIKRKYRSAEGSRTSTAQLVSLLPQAETKQ